MSYTITNNIMYVRDDAGNLVPVSMIASGADQTIQAIKDTASAAEAQIDTKVSDANAAIEAKTDEQAARIPEVTTLAEDVNELKDDIAGLRQSTRNIFDENALIVDGITKGEDGYYYGTVRSWNAAFSSMLPVDGTFESGEMYTVSCTYYFSEVGDWSGNAIRIKATYTDGGSDNLFGFNSLNQEETYVYETTRLSKSVAHLSMNLSDARANKYVLHIKELQIEKGIENTPFVEHFTARDANAEERLSNAEDIKVQALLGSFLGRKERYYDHIFVDKLYGKAVIPSESIFNIESSRRLGFSVIEANVHKLSDGNYLVMHGENGKFGRQVVHVDGETNIAETSFSSVTLEWVKTNVRYASSYEKYRVAPPSLQEFASACKYNCLIPLVQIVDTTEIDILNKILGKDNFIAYNNTPLDIRKATSAFIFGWNGFDTKEKIVKWVMKFKPCSYGMSNIGSFTDDELKDIVDAVHAEGCYIHTAYAKADTQERVNKLGFDFSASLYSVNEFESGNICNLCGDATFDDFATSGMAANGEITLAADQDVSPGKTLSSVFLGKGSLHIRFNGTIEVSMGRYINSTYGGNSFTCDGTEDLWLSTFFIEEAPTFTITAKTETTILGISYKASKC